MSSQVPHRPSPLLQRARDKVPAEYSDILRCEEAWPVYEFLREPVCLQELAYFEKALWRDNGTVAYKSPGGICPPYYTDKHPYIQLTISHATKPFLHFTIVGKEEDAIAETAAYFWSIRDSDLFID